MEPAGTAAPQVSTDEQGVNGRSLPELEAITSRFRWPKYRAQQLFRWLHQKGAQTFAEMTDLSKEDRSLLEEHVRMDTLRLEQAQCSVDGTRKLRFATSDGLNIESVLIPEAHKLTLCVSSQAGCALGCTFCATAKLGLTRHLSAGEIVAQVYAAAAIATQQMGGQPITNLVFMGMGEPLHNFDETYRAFDLLSHPLGLHLSPRRITVSTAGMVPGIERLGASTIRVQLAISLNATTDETRSEIMPINRKWNLAALLGALRRYPLEPRRRITFEYVLIAGLNDTPADARRLPKLLAGLRSKINLIPWNPHTQSPYERPSWERVFAFQKEVQAAGLPVYLRKPRGDDIAGACGQLANENESALPLSAKLASPFAGLAAVTDGTFAVGPARRPPAPLVDASFLLREIQKS